MPPLAARFIYRVPAGCVIVLFFAAFACCAMRLLL